MKHLKRQGLIICSIVSIVAMLLYASFHHYAESPVSSEDRQLEIKIDRGKSFSDIVSLLDDAGLITQKNYFLLLAHLRGAPKNIKAGEYELNSSMTPSCIIESLMEGRVKVYSITIPEGFTVRQIAARLAANGIVDESRFISLTRDEKLLSSLEIKGTSAEGYLFPETYLFSRFMGESQVIKFMVDCFWSMITPEMKGRAKELGFTFNEIVTLASIIEKEGGGKDEKPTVAAVFQNRLKRGMRLQSDPTVIYDIDNFDGNLKKSHLEEKTPHNTYQIGGLPPGPICNPGMDSILAALYPAPVDYLYFVSKRDGSHHFSSNLKSHNEAVTTYQIKRRK